VAGLFAAGVLRRSDAVLDVGCGDGTDCFALMSWGVRKVRGIDADPNMVGRACRRAAALGLPDVFHEGSITDIHPCFDDQEFSVVIDSLCWNNIEAYSPRATPAYVKQVWRVLRPGGRLVLQARMSGVHVLEAVPGDLLLPPVFGRYFAMSPALTTHLPERPQSKRSVAWATVVVSVGRRRFRPQPRG
jgi:SAM-dependent methyltransferase